MNSKPLPGRRQLWTSVPPPLAPRELSTQGQDKGRRERAGQGRHPENTSLPGSTTLCHHPSSGS